MVIAVVTATYRKGVLLNPALGLGCGEYNSRRYYRKQDFYFFQRFLSGLKPIICGHSPFEG